MERKIIYSKKYMDENDEMEKLLRAQSNGQNCLDSSLLSKEATEGLLKLLKSQDNDEPLDDELSPECRKFMLKCIYISDFNYLNLDITQTSRELIAEFQTDYANYNDFKDIYLLADKIEFNAVSEIFMSIKFTFILHK